MCRNCGMASKFLKKEKSAEKILSYWNPDGVAT
jgi:hypothetical protein